MLKGKLKKNTYFSQKVTLFSQLVVHGSVILRVEALKKNGWEFNQLLLNLKLTTSGSLCYNVNTLRHFKVDPVLNNWWGFSHLSESMWLIRYLKITVITRKVWNRKTTFKLKLGLKLVQWSLNINHSNWYSVNRPLFN